MITIDDIMTYRKFAKRVLGKKRYRNYNNGFGQLKNDVMMLKNLINVEQKFIDTSSSIAVSNTGALTCTNLVGQGTNLTDRVGDSVKMKSLQVEGNVTLNASATNDYVRLAVVLDRQPNGAAASYTDIYETNSPIAFRNKLTVDRFVVLKELKFALATAGDTNKRFSWYKKFPLGKDFHEKFNGTGNTIAAIYTNAVFIVYCGQQPTNTSTLNVNTRMRFVDN